MASGEVCCWTPYTECLVIIGWALEIWPDIHGRMMMNGVDYMSLDAADMMDLLYSCIVDDVMRGDVSRNEVREQIEKQLASEVFQVNAQRLKINPETPMPEPEPFKLTPDFLGMVAKPKRGDG